MTNLSFRHAKPSDLDRCYQIETTAYAGDEAATKDKILKRIEMYPEGFLILENDKEIIGFVNCGAADKVELSDESFKELVGHHSDGNNIVIMSVVTHPDYQRQGMATRLMKRFIEQMREAGKHKVLLLCQMELIPMYASFGFVDLGPSESDHGGLQWHEMEMVL